MNSRSMRSRAALTMVLASLLLWYQPAATAADIYVICHPGVKLAASDVRDVFLGEKQFAESVKLTPVDNAAAQSEFLSRVIKLDANKYSTIWTKKSFRDGINPPSVKASDSEIIEFVRRNPGAIGYVFNTATGVVIVHSY